jgi:hypothetical protein
LKRKNKIFYGGGAEVEQDNLGGAKAAKQNNNNNTMMKKAMDSTKPSCAPHKNPNSHKEFTCFSDAALVKLKNTWNARHPAVNERITSNDSKEIWMQLKKNMSSTCNQEMCWLKQEIFKNMNDKELLNFTFSPTAPKSWSKNPNEWLSSLEITSVMKQYEKEYPEFDFIGPSPIDFMKKEVDGRCVWQELCEFNVGKLLKQKKQKIGIIFNTDPHDKSGSHWISLFINFDVKAPFIFFFDSNGSDAPKEVQAFITDIIKPQMLAQPELANAKIVEETNAKTASHGAVQHQHGNTECGMYSLYLIISLLTGQEHHKTFNDFKNANMIITDKNMEALRHKLYNFQQV